ncbi:hypothetical protein BKA65DRAFT_74401 [Rhexocercosporidium sp. MPI-PUGE-AT-0058]|nr:hypothetical protein BKA65DRAFT_74401 [Rhexocercosporidium sp. MPI-PUGE-AT-0058]
MWQDRPPTSRFFSRYSHKVVNNNKTTVEKRMSLDASFKKINARCEPEPKLVHAYSPVASRDHSAKSLVESSAMVEPLPPLPPPYDFENRYENPHSQIHRQNHQQIHKIVVDLESQTSTITFRVRTTTTHALMLLVVTSFFCVTIVLVCFFSK